MSDAANSGRVPQLRRLPQGADSPLWWAIVMLILIELTVFSVLISSYFFLALVNPIWPPTGTKLPEVLVPTLNTVVLLLAGAAITVADRTIRSNNQTLLVAGEALGIVFGIVFLAVKAYEFSHLEYDWSSHAYGSIVYTISAFHAAHVIVAILKTIPLLIMAIRGTYDSESRLAVEINGIYWQFVVLIWIPIYLTVYISPHFS